MSGNTETIVFDINWTSGQAGNEGSDEIWGLLQIAIENAASYPVFEAEVLHNLAELSKGGLSDDGLEYLKRFGVDLTNVRSKPIIG